MKYISVFATTLLIWIATLLVALILESPQEAFQLYLGVTILTLVLFFIGFGKEK
jgi:hypothetical protein